MTVLMPVLRVIAKHSLTFVVVVTVLRVVIKELPL